MGLIGLRLWWLWCWLAVDLCGSPVEVEIEAGLAKPSKGDLGPLLWSLSVDAKVLEGAGAGRVRRLRIRCL